MVRPRCVLEMENSPPLLLLRKGREGQEERQRKVVGEGRGGGGVAVTQMQSD